MREIIKKNLRVIKKYYSSKLNSSGNEMNIFDACLGTFEIGHIANLIAKEFSSSVERKEITDGIDEYKGDSEFLLNFLKSKNLQWQITDKKIVNLIQ